MSIATAIAALSPNIWYKLDGSDGESAPNSGSLANNGTPSGTLDWTVPGPEIDTTALRLFTTGQIVSAAMDVSSFTTLSLGMWVSTWANGTNNVVYPVLGIGDVANRLARGPLLAEVHGSQGATNWRGPWNTQVVPQGLAPQPSLGWHWVVATYQAGSGGIKLYIDGTIIQTATPSGNVAAQLSDPLLLRSDEPMVVAHVCFWNTTLGQSAIQSVSNELAQWPYTQPINLPAGGGGGGGGLTEAQAEQLSDIDTKTDDIPGLTAAATYISETVNTINANVDQLLLNVASLDGKMDEALGHLNTLLEATAEQTIPLLNDIKDAVTRIFLTSAGLGLSTPLGSVLAHPDPNLLHADATSFVISGQGTLTPPGPLSYGNVYGIRWTATTVPPGVGFRDGIIPSYTQRLVQWVLWYPDVGDLELHAQEIAEFRYHNFTWLWDRPYPNTIQYDVLPGFELTCRFILLSPLA